MPPISSNTWRLRPDAKLILEGYAGRSRHDRIQPGTVPTPPAIGEERISRRMGFLPTGLRPGYGKQKSLTDKRVEELTAKNPNITRLEREGAAPYTFFSGFGQQPPRGHSPEHGLTSERFYPFNSAI